MSMHNQKLQPRGFTIFFAILVASLALSIGLAIFDLTVRSLRLSSISTQSQYAIYASDTGAECALYWDSKYYSGSQFLFATSSQSGTPPTGAPCNGQNINTGWTVLTSANAATTTFTLTLPNNRCAVVTVAKSQDASGVNRTAITSYGYNTCSVGNPNRLERVFRVTY